MRSDGVGQVEKGKVRLGFVGRDCLKLGRPGNIG